MMHLDQALRVDVVREWMEAHPRESWAFARLSDDDDLRYRIVESLVSGRDSEELVHLTRFAEALEHRERCARDGSLRSAPEIGERRPFEGWIPLISRLESSVGAPFFRVDFRAREGWSGYFDTTIPQDIERIAKMKDRTKLVVVVGEIVKSPYDCFVIFGERTRLV